MGLSLANVNYRNPAREVPCAPKEIDNPRIDVAHIAMLIPNLRGGGAERITLRIAGGLVKLGHSVDIVLFEPAFDFNSDIPENARLMVLCGRDVVQASSNVPRNAHWRDERAPLTLLARLAALVGSNRLRLLMLHRKVAAYVLRLISYIERERPDIIFANLPRMEYAALLAARTLSLPPPQIVPVVHSVFGQNSRQSRRRRLLFPAVTHVVAVSHGVAENICDTLGIAKNRVTTIQNPAYSPRIARLAELRPDHHWFADAGPPIILGVGRLVPDKDFLTLLEAFQLTRTQQMCRLLILGEGRLRGTLEKRVRKLGISDDVSMPGWAENPYAFMSRVSLFVLSSRREGFPTVLVEALACGCPSVSTDCPAGPSEILEAPELLAPVGDPKALANVMLLALSRPRNSMALRAKAEQFSVKRAAQEYDKLISGVVSI